MQRLQIKTFQWHYSLLLIPIVLWLSAGNAHATLKVSCKANMNTGVVNIGNAITTTNSESANITGNLEYSCTNTGDTAGYVSVCLAADGGNTPNAVIPRYMNTASNTDKLAFDMILPNGKTWGTRTSGLGMEYSSGAIYIPARSTTSGQSNISGQVVINMSLLPNHGNTLATPGTYTNNFNGDLTFKTAENSSLTDCLEGVQDKSNSFAFTVQATVISSCEITAKPTDINLKNIAASATNIKGSTNIGVTCTNTAPYTIGLGPISSNKTDGSGFMSGTSGNSDRIPYQLRSADGTAWGNTLTAESVGNGVAYNGTGVNQSHTVYVVISSADVKPDYYSDIVTINVNY